MDMESTTTDNFESLENCLTKHLPQTDLEEVKRILYGKPVNLCLPLESRTLADSLYLLTLLTFSVVAFCAVCACYGRMYCVVRGDGQGAVARSDATVAKRMALLVFTDFACWAPIAFFGLTALAGKPLIDVPRTKVLLVCFYPLNACANPLLYALLSRQYRRDLLLLLSKHGLCSKRAARYKGAAPSTLTSMDTKQPQTRGVELRAAVVAPVPAVMESASSYL